MKIQKYFAFLFYFI